MFTRRRLLQCLSVVIVLSMMFSGLHAPSASAQGGDGIKRQVNAQTGKVSFISPESGRALPASKALGLSPSARPADPGIALAKRFGPEFGVKDPARDLKKMKTNRSDNGRLSLRYQQHYQEIPILGGELIINTNEKGDLYSMNGEVSPDLSLSTQPTIDSAQARDAALRAAAKWYSVTPDDLAVSTPALWIFDESLLRPSTRPAELVWRMEVTPKEIGLPVRELVLVNAERGGISLHFNQVDTVWGEFAKEKRSLALNTTSENTRLDSANAVTNSATRDLVTTDSDISIRKADFAPTTDDFEFQGNGTVPASIDVYRGTPQHVWVGHAAPSVLKAVVRDAGGAAVQGITVAFTAPAIGASAVFADTGTNTTTAVTNADGIATSPSFTANDLAGYYVIQAAVAGLTSPAEFEITNGSEVKTYTANNNRTVNLPGTLVCDQNTPSCTSGINARADRAHLYAMGTYRLFMEKHGRWGIDDNNMPIISTVDYCSRYPDDVCPFDNANWTGTQVVYGSVYGFALADDVVAHEITHGVTQYASDLYYYYQSGAINESFSDLWGEYYDQGNGLGKDTANDRWKVGEDVSGLGSMRSMSNPPAYGHPDRMTSGNYYTGEKDNGGVHWNSGVNNKAVYLMVDGNGTTVTAIGWEKTAAIYYEANTRLLTSGADYSDLYYALPQACSNLIGQKGITSGDCAQVFNAITAVNMNYDPVPGTLPDASYNCGPSSSPVILFSDDLESGTGNWTFNNGPYTHWQLDSPYPYSEYAYSGDHFLYGDDYPDLVTDATAQLVPVEIPANAYLRFAHAYDLETDLPDYYDAGVLEYRIENETGWLDAGPLLGPQDYRGTVFNGAGNPLSGRKAFVGASHGYIHTRANLASLAGRRVSFRWRLGLDEMAYQGGWWVDDIEIYRCSAENNAPATINLAATTGTAGGTVQLNWTAVGDDGATGNASAYLVRYSTRAITDEFTWNNAKAVTTGIPTPQAAGLPESMTVSELIPNQTYYFAVRARDDEANLGGIFSASATARVPEPVGSGIYDDANTSASWIYSGDWVDYTGSGPANNTVHYTGTQGDAASFVFTGAKFTLTFTKSFNRGRFEVWLDNDTTDPVLVTMIDANQSTRAWQETYISRVYPVDTYTLTIKHVGPAGKYIDIDKIQIYVDTTAPAAIDDLVATTGASNGLVDLSWTAVGDDGMDGTASSYLVRYSPNAIDADNWDSATPVTAGIPVPEAAGALQSMTVSGLQPWAKYYFAVRAQDEDTNAGDFVASSALAPGPTTWFIRGVGQIAYGLADDTPAAGDYNGDGKDEIAVYRPSNGTWYLRGIGPTVYGTPEDIPVPADYNGDDKADIAVYRPSNGTWYIKGMGATLYGTPEDIPVPADYNGDGKDEIAVYRPSNGTWYVKGMGATVYGTPEDIPVPADYNGDGKDEIAVYRPSNGTWYIKGMGASVYGLTADIPQAGDYNGDGKAEIAVFRPSNSTWYIKGIGATVYGMAGDIPVAADYNGDGKIDITVFRPDR